MKLFKSINSSALGGGYNNKLKLKKYKENNSKIIVGIFCVLIIFALSGVYLYRTYATFTEEKKFNVINGEIQDPGDIYFAYYVDDTITKEMPKQNTGYTLDTEKTNCTNGVIPTWDDSTWSINLNYQNYNATDYTRTKCNLYFVEKKYTLVEYITTLANTDTTNFAVDDYGNTRYIGKSPNNYISFDGDMWRIIGIMKDIDDGTGNLSDRVKIIKNAGIGGYPWDTSDSSINSGYGVNEWSQADLMKLLNPGYESESVGGSLYWNNKSGTCYTNIKNATSSCGFTSNGIKESLKNMIGNAIWKTGAITTLNQTVRSLYSEERGTKNGKICTKGNNCTDTVSRTTSWTGRLALIYPSDYGYATSGGSTTDRATCLNTNIGTWNTVTECYNNSWLRGGYRYMLSPLASSSSAASVIIGTNTNARIGNNYASVDYSTYPAAYLLSSVKIQSGDGTYSNPYILSGN